jgi:hypothetical protein
MMGNGIGKREQTYGPATPSGIGERRRQQFESQTQTWAFSGRLNGPTLIKFVRFFNWHHRKSGFAQLRLGTVE